MNNSENGFRSEASRDYPSMDESFPNRFKNPEQQMQVFSELMSAANAREEEAK